MSALPPIGQKVLLVGGPFDGCTTEFSGSRHIVMHDPDRILPGDRAGASAMYRFNLDMLSEIGKIRIASADWVQDAPTDLLKRPNQRFIR